MIIMRQLTMPLCNLVSMQDGQGGPPLSVNRVDITAGAPLRERRLFPLPRGNYTGVAYIA